MSPSADEASPATGVPSEQVEAQPATEPRSSIITKSGQPTPLDSQRHAQPKDRSLVAAKSPERSRESSPIRPQPRSVTTSLTRPGRSRKNSQELSPNRQSALSGSIASVPSAAAIQRALSVHKLPLQGPGGDGGLEGAHGERIPSSTEHSPRWPTSPRLKSPPPSSALRSSIPTLRKAETDTVLSNTSIKRLTVASTPGQDANHSQNGGDSEGSHGYPGLRSSGRGPSTGTSGLETVVENSLSSTPATGSILDAFTSQTTEPHPLNHSTSETKVKDHVSGASGEETGSSKSNSKKTDAPPQANASTSHRPAAIATKRSFTTLAPAKNKPAADTMRTMTVETEPVTSLPPIPLGANGERGLSGRMTSTGAIRSKPSSETIRPKKEKRKSARKAPSLHSGTVSSKADIFEAKVATAVGQASSSDSEETFVYESNPPDRSTHAGRHHSRTPSATSLVSQMDPPGTRHKANNREASQSVSGKRSMKFTNNAFNHNLDGENGNAGSHRGNGKNGHSTPRHHHIGRHGRGGHASLFDTDSPFTQASKAASPRPASAAQSKLLRPGSPRVGGGRGPGSPRKGDVYAYDLDEEGADDERTPLVGSVRVNRSRHSRRPHSGSLRHVEYVDQDPPSRCGRYGACAMATILLLVLCMGIGTFVMALNKPLLNVSVKRLHNVLVSEQEIMLDMEVQALNPNLFAIVVGELDVNLFATSGYVESFGDWRERDESSRSAWMRRRRLVAADPRANAAPRNKVEMGRGIDEGTDPIDDPEWDPQTMLLGRVLEFDSPLVFEASPLRRTPTSSIGALRLAKPGNKTEDGDSGRWERVLQHPFELIVRGVIRYQLPISSNSRTAALGGRIKVYPKEERDDGTSTLGEWA